jgi:peroxin-6
MPSAVETVDVEPVSISTVASVRFINDPSVGVFDTIQISQDVYDRVFPRGSGGDEFVLIKLIGSSHFHSFNIYKVAAICDGTNEVKFLNHSNFARYPSDKLTLNSAMIQSIDKKDICPLGQIYVSVPESIYQLLNDKPQPSLRNHFAQCLDFNGGVVNENDHIRQLNGRIRLCEPIPQGLVNHNTSIILIKQKHIDVVEHMGTVNDMLAATEEQDEDSDYDEDAEIDVSAYLSKSLRYQDAAADSTPFIVKPLPEKISVHGLPEAWAKEDSELFVFFNASDFIKLGFLAFNGDLVSLRIGEESKIVVKVFTFTEPNNFEAGTVYLSPILMINCGLKPDSTVTFSPFKAESANLLAKALPIAESVTISRVASQITMDRTYQKHFFSSLKTSLSNQFRVVQKGDFFAVVIDSVLAKTMFDTQSSDEDNEDSEINDANDVIPIGEPDVVAWFKIVDMKGENTVGTNQFVIDPKQTLLVSSGVEFIRLPQNEGFEWYNYLKLPPMFNFNHRAQVTGEFSYAKEFKKIIQTNLSSKIGLRTTILLNSLSRGIGKTSLVRNMSTELGLNLIELDCFDLINPGQELKTIGILMGKIDKLIQTPNTSTDAFNLIYLKHIENLCPSTDSNDQNSNIQTSLSLKIAQTLQDYLMKYQNLAIVMSCNDFDKLNENISSLVKFNITFNVPKEKERLEIFKFLINNETDKDTSLLSQPNNSKENIKIEFTSNSITDATKCPFSIRNDISFQALALQSAGLTPRDLISIIKMSKKAAISRLYDLSLESKINLNKLIRVSNGGVIKWIPEDFTNAINEARNQFSDSIGAPRIPNVKWEDIGGLDLVKDEILDTIDMPLKHPELFKSGLKKRSGILFYGPPGTGKTLLAKAIATNFSLNFFSVKGPELLNMYIGESEANVRRVFQKARDAKPCVIFFDELDSVAPKRGNQGDSGGVMDRIVSQLLAELDGMGADGDGVFVVGATNRPDLLDEALLRPGRFDKMLYLGISDTDDKQTKILEALTRKFKIDDSVDLAQIAKLCSFTYTGADFYALCSDSMLNAMTRVAGEVDAKINEYNKKVKEQDKPEVSTRWWFDNVAQPEDIEVLVKMADFVKSQQELTPSVSAEELQHYLRVRENFEGGKEKAQQEGNATNNDVTLPNGTVPNGHLEDGITIDLSGGDENQ